MLLGYSNFPGTTWKNANLKPGKYGIFYMLYLFFYPSLPKLRHSYPTKNAVLELARQWL